MDILFEITNKTKNKARKRRVRYEKKWLILRIISYIAFSLSIYAFIKGIYFVPFEDHDLDLIYSIIFSVALIVGVFARALIYGFTRRWIKDRYNERIWVEDGKLYHFMQKPIGMGINKFRIDLSAYLFISDLYAITNARYDDKTGRMEIASRGEYIYYSDFLTQTVQDAGMLPEDFTDIYYDYTEPSLYESLKSAGVHFTVEPINFSIFDSRI